MGKIAHTDIPELNALPGILSIEHGGTGNNLGRAPFLGINFLNDGDDLNNFMTPGLYTCSTTATSQTILNMPTPDETRAFCVFVLYNSGPVQIYIEHLTLRIFIRRGYYDWYDWIQLFGAEKDIRRIVNDVLKEKGL